MMKKLNAAKLNAEKIAAKFGTVMAVPMLLTVPAFASYDDVVNPIISLLNTSIEATLSFLSSIIVGLMYESTAE